MEEKEFSISDDDIVRLVQTGHTRNFESLINRYKDRIVNFIHKMIFDYDEAQSLTQDVFLKVFESLGKYNSQNNFQAFIFTIAKNTTLNYIKKQKRVLFFSGFFHENDEEKHFKTEDNQHRAMEETQQQEMLNTALGTLNENQRLALIMKVYLNFSYTRIAEITGWSEPKIETLISRAKSNLKSNITGILNTAPAGGQQPGFFKKNIPFTIFKKNVQEKSD